MHASIEHALDLAGVSLEDQHTVRTDERDARRSDQIRRVDANGERRIEHGRSVGLCTGVTEIACDNASQTEEGSDFNEVPVRGHERLQLTCEASTRQPIATR